MKKNKSATLLAIMLRSSQLFWIASMSMLVSAPALAWGPEGHALIADMAEAHLTPDSLQQVRQLLVLEGDKHLDQIASWPDAIRSSAPETGAWHFVDIPLYADGYNASRDCHAEGKDEYGDDGNCIVEKLPEFVRQLSNRALPAEQRLIALKWVVHLVGDIHQPLHTENDHDRGGNFLQLNYYGEQTNLHAMWDLGVIERHFNWHLAPHYGIDRRKVYYSALQLDHAITVAQRRQWSVSDQGKNIDQRSIAWANSSHALAWSAYQHLPINPHSRDWEGSYQAYAWPVVLQQLDKAGVCLAAVLNQALVMQH